MTATTTAIQARRAVLLDEIDDLIALVIPNLELAKQNPRGVPDAGRVRELIEDCADNLVHALRLCDQAVLLEDLLK